MNTLEQRQESHEIIGTEEINEPPPLFGQPCCGAQVYLIYHYIDKETPGETADAVLAAEALLLSLYPVVECPACSATWHAVPLVTYKTAPIEARQLAWWRKVTGIAPDNGAEDPNASYFKFVEV
jgi:hypothetical protein